jgi:hypothetical protein
MQFDMYHHYTVDEHTIRAIGLLARIEKGELAADHPLATMLFTKIHSRRAIYCAVLMHDIAKGRGATIRSWAPTSPNGCARALACPMRKPSWSAGWCASISS